MTNEPNNKVSEKLDKETKKFFFAVEHTSATSPIDIDEFCSLMNVVCKKYNMKWCQAFWKDERMQRIRKD